MKTVQQQPCKILAQKGKRQVGFLTSAEGGINVTLPPRSLCAMNVCGLYVPPVFIFARKGENPLLLDHAPPSSKMFIQDSEWMTSLLFRDYLQHFVEFVKPSPEKTGPIYTRRAHIPHKVNFSTGLCVFLWDCNAQFATTYHTQIVSPPTCREKSSSYSANDNCVVCGEFGKDKEIWFRCRMCGFWAHMACTGHNKANTYTCDDCRYINVMYRRSIILLFKPTLLLQTTT